MDFVTQAKKYVPEFAVVKADLKKFAKDVINDIENQYHKTSLKSKWRVSLVKVAFRFAQICLRFASDLGKKTKTKTSLTFCSFQSIFQLIFIFFQRK